ncbi:DinB family protein [Virgibacillus byunsanensis]|uniref:DinB family protein n=1 Tax=Virgibacillus byunsanensis TaxID=570945 RepID=A0ABW3LSR3_9BACI
MLKQFDSTRIALVAFVNNLDEKIVDIQPESFNNTIRWHIGHVLVSSEGLLFGFPSQSTNIPEHYHTLFATGTKPADWSEDVPTLNELVTNLEEQATRIKQLSDEFFEKTLPYTLPFGNFKTYGDVFRMILQHESEHLGQMKAMKRVVNEN